MRDAFGLAGLQLLQHGAACGQVRVEFEDALQCGLRLVRVAAEALRAHQI